MTKACLCIVVRMVHDDDMTEMTFEQYQAIMATKSGVQPYTERQWAQMSSQHKVLLAFTYRREMAAL